MQQAVFKHEVDILLGRVRWKAAFGCRGQMRVSRRNVTEPRAEFCRVGVSVRGRDSGSYSGTGSASRVVLQPMRHASPGVEMPSDLISQHLQLDP